MQRTFTMLGLLATLAACGPSDLGTNEQDVIVDTESELAWNQYVANLEFARGYVARCDKTAAADADHRVVVTGFGRFLSNPDNATGGMVSELLEELDYPLTEAPQRGEIDPPGPQTAVAQGIIELPGAGTVAVCAIILPVYWDLAPYLVAQEMRAFEPDLVLMNGIAGWRQETWLELGAVNRAKRLGDGSDISKPQEDRAPLIPTADASEYARPNLASWEAMETAMGAALDANKDTLRDGIAFSDVVHGTLLAGYPRVSNTYLCNNVTYTVGYLMDHADEEVTLMEASHVREDATDSSGAPLDAGNGLPITLGVDLSTVPRLFMHWSSNIKREHLAPGADLMRAAIDAQLTTLDAEVGGPVRGDNAFADLAGSGIDGGGTH